MKAEERQFLISQVWLDDLPGLPDEPSEIPTVYRLSDSNGPTATVVVAPSG